MPRRVVLWVLAVVLGLAALGAVLDALGLDQESNDSGEREGTRSREETRERRPGRPRGDEKGRLGDRLAGRRARVTEVIDGDTVVLDRVGRVRLIGVDTPEEGRCYESAATRFTRRRIGGELVRYELGVERKDRYGRTLAYLYRGARMHNLALVREGYARVLTIPPNDRYAARFMRAEIKARGVEVGLWDTCAGRGGRSMQTARPRPRRDRTSSAPSGGTPPPPPPDLDCSDVAGPVPVGPGDPHRLDRDGDGIGCD